MWGRAGGWTSRVAAGTAAGMGSVEGVPGAPRISVVIGMAGGEVVSVGGVEVGSVVIGVAEVVGLAATGVVTGGLAVASAAIVAVARTALVVRRAVASAGTGADARLEVIGSGRAV